MEYRLLSSGLVGVAAEAKASRVCFFFVLLGGMANISNQRNWLDAEGGVLVHICHHKVKEEKNMFKEE